MGVFDLCHFDLLKRGCANSGGGLELAEHLLETLIENVSFSALLVIISGNSLVFSRKIITSTVFLPVLRPRRISTSSGNK